MEAVARTVAKINSIILYRKPFFGSGQLKKVKLPVLSRFNQQIHVKLFNQNELIMQGSKIRQGWLNACDEYLSNRPQVSMVYRLINHAGCW